MGASWLFLIVMGLIAIKLADTGQAHPREVHIAKREDECTKVDIVKRSTDDDEDEDEGESSVKGDEEDEEVEKPKKEDDDQEDAEDDGEDKKKHKKKGKKAKAKVEEEDEEDEEEEKPKKKPKKTKPKKVEDEEEEEDEGKGKTKTKGKKKKQKSEVAVAVNVADQCQLDEADFKPKKVETEADARQISQDPVGSQLQAAFNWQSLLTPAPHVLCLLGQINVLGSQRDFPMTNSKTALKFMKYPNSFRATLTQLGNEGLKAFEAAHKNMGQMSKHLQEIPAKIREAVNYLDRPQSKTLGTRIEIALRAIRDRTDMCLQLTNATEAKFMGVQSLLLEILEVCQLKRGQEEQRVREVEAEMQATKRQKELYQELKQQAQEEREKTEQRMNQSEQAYKKARDDIPGSWEVLAQTIVKTTLDLAKDVATTMAATFNPLGGLINGAVTRVSSGGSSVQDMNAARDDMKAQGEQAGLVRIIAQATQVQTILGAFVDQLRKKMNAVAIDKGGINIADLDKAAEGILHPVENAVNAVEEAEVPAAALEYKTKVSGVLTKAKDLLTVYSELNDKRKREEDDDEEGAETPEKDDEEEEKKPAKKKDKKGNKKAEKIVEEKLPQLQECLDELKAVVTQGRSASRSSQQQGSAPASNKALSPEQETAEMELRRLQMNQEQHAQANNELKIIMHNLTAISSKIESLDLTKIELGEIIEILKQALKYLELLKEQWSKLLQFFSMLASDTKALLGTNVKEFLEHMNTASEGADAYFKADMKCKEFTILKISNHLFLMSSTYYTVSNLFLMPRISSLTSLLNVASDSERKTQIAALKANATLAEKQIVEIADEQNKQYNEFIQKNIENLQKQITTDTVGDKEEEKKK